MDIPFISILLWTYRFLEYLTLRVDKEDKSGNKRIERKQGESHAIRYLPMFPLSFGLKERLIMGVLKIICVARVASSGVNMSIADTVIYSILP